MAFSIFRDPEHEAPQDRRCAGTPQKTAGDEPSNLKVPEFVFVPYLTFDMIRCGSVMKIFQNHQGKMFIPFVKIPLSFAE